MLLISLLLLFLAAPSNLNKTVTTVWHGGVAPHHVLIMNEIERFWKTANSQYDPVVIILVGPDHHNIGQTEVTTNQQGYNYLSDLPFVQIDSVIEQDHSIQTHLSIIKELFPGIPILPLVIRSDANQEQILTLAHRLHNSLDGIGEVFVVASVDFSHYLPLAEAEQKDIESLSRGNEFFI
ncbi:MAG: AmmeMemoRadiSam system protein B [Candidatus Kerfeldbacteria bacterium]|nr:AmmeMemoRadiSam system protein B [Candidatus Kerfeldbacteria bacterium]